MWIHVYFNIAKIIYSAIGRSDKKFLLYETAGALIVIFIALFFADPFHQILVEHIPDSLTVNLLFSSMWAPLYLFTSFLSRLSHQKNPEEVSDAPNNYKVIPIGIIDFSWLTIMAATYSGLFFCRSFEILYERMLSEKSQEYYQMYYDELMFFFNKSIDMGLLLGSILAVCMTILWGGEIWRKRDNTSRNHYINTTQASIKMVIAFFTVCGATALWISIPLFQKLTAIKNFLY